MLKGAQIEGGKLLSKRKILICFGKRRSEEEYRSEGYSPLCRERWPMEYKLKAPTTVWN
jgi:hypothetical protein